MQGQRAIVVASLPDADPYRSIVRTGWIVEHDSDVPRLTSAYVKPDLTPD